MKKEILKYSTIIALLGLMLSFNKVIAQKTDKTWSIGLEAGANFSKYGKDAVNSDFKPGLILGGNLTYSIKNTFGITGKLLYSQKGQQNTTSGITTKQTLNYIEIPVIGRMFFNSEGTFRPNIFVGPSFGFLTSASNQTGSADRVKMDNYKMVFNTFDLGITGGLGFNYQLMNETWLLIDLRYTHGLSDITKASTSSINNQAIAITAGFAIGI